MHLTEFKKPRRVWVNSPSTLPYDPQLLYGTFLDIPNNRASFDGKCGIQSLIAAYAAAGITIRADHNKKGYTVGFFVTWGGE